MERKAHWYSVIQYCPNEIRGEKVNVGLILHSPSDGLLYHSLLDESSSKIRGIAYDEVSQKTFKVNKDIVDYYFKQIIESPDIFRPNLNDNKFLLQIKEEFPKSFILSEPTFSLTSNPTQLFDSLIKTYVGEQYLSKEILTAEEYKRNVKTYTKTIFTQRELLGTKVKSNVKVHPIKGLKNVHFNVDFIFRNGLWNLIQTVPSNSTSEKLIEWFSKTNTMIENIENEADFYLVYDNNDEMNKDKTITQMVSLLQKKDRRVDAAEVESESFRAMCNKVEREGKDISDYEQELIAM